MSVAMLNVEVRVSKTQVRPSDALCLIDVKSLSATAFLFTYHPIHSHSGVRLLRS